MAKPEWGTKRECAECATRFYDLNREPILCPSCEAKFVIEVAKPSPKSRAKPSKVTKPVPVKSEETEETEDDEAALLKTAGIEEDSSDDDGEEDGVVGDVFVEDDDDEDDVSNVLDTPVSTPTVE
ncbi:MAG: TIGR02300 family protein [Alphaproteobacteria bacterium]|nr:TIGR02300 family protein [Alphaproteobacteria bacterium]MBT5158899.1 TIGR02300 family protein [Alphaproteobacteria bacterium]MBT5918906.1 TIGR02300 family protein [Alphaproteobacteria bacterium]MBT6387154.1 TIGR02300 family protein [Alphaproteobacteria bacterium]